MGKYIAGILGAVALAWITYVGINIASTGNSVNPDSVFPSRIPAVIVAHRPFDHDFVLTSGILRDNALVQSLFENPERVQHMYFASSEDIILLERSKPWTIEIVKQFLRKNNLSGEFTAARSLRISNGWFARFDKEYLVLSAKEIALSNEKRVNWKYIDRKSNYSIVDRNQGRLPFIENIYQKPNGKLVYVSNYNALGKHIADDQDIFADAIPADLESYTFYEKEYLRSLGDADPDFFTWTDAGAAVISYNGRQCILTDFLPSQDPIAVLGDKVEEASLNDAKTSGHVKGSKLPGTLLKTSDYYIEVFNNRVYIAKEKNTIDALIGVYESGKTLVQSPEKYSSLFEGSTKKVSFREISGSQHRTISLLDGSRHTVVQQLSGSTVPEVKTTTGPQLVRIDGGIEQVLPVQQSNFVYVLSKTGVLYGISGTKVQWQLQFDQRLSGPISFSGTNQTDVIAVTTGAVHIVGQNGAERTMTGSGSEILGATTFSWRGSEQAAIVERSGITVINGNGRKNTISYNFENTPSQTSAWVNGGDLRVTVLNGNKLLTVSVDRKRRLKELTLNGSGSVLLKSDQGPFAYTLISGMAQRTKWSGEQARLGKASRLSVSDNRKNLIMLSDATVIVADASGNTLSNFRLASANTEMAVYAESSSGKAAIAGLDGIVNQNYVYGISGVRLSGDQMEGSGVTALQYAPNGSLNLISQSNGYLVRYKIK